MELLKATLEDTEELARLNLELMTAEDYDKKLPLEGLLPRMSSFLQTEYDAFYIILKRGKAGYILINKTSKPLYIRQFYILPGFQRKGLGQKTIKVLQLLCNFLNDYGTIELGLDYHRLIFSVSEKH